MAADILRKITGNLGGRRKETGLRAQRETRGPINKKTVRYEPGKHRYKKIEHQSPRVKVDGQETVQTRTDIRVGSLATILNKASVKVVHFWA